MIFCKIRTYFSNQFLECEKQNTGLNIKLNGEMMIIFANYESHILKQKMMNKKRKYDNI